MHDLIVRAQQGDVDAASKLLEQHYPKMYYRATYWCDHEAALEIRQNAALRAWRKLRYYDVCYAFEPWLMTLVNHEASRYAEKEKWRMRLAHIDYVDFMAPGWDYAKLVNPATFDSINYACLVSDILDVLNRMPDKQRTIMLLFLNGYSYKEIIQYTGATWHSVNSYIKRAKKKLQAELG